MKKDRMTKEQFREMTFKAKLQWFLQYYGIAAVVAIIAIGVVINLVKTVLFPEAAPDGHVVILADEITQAEALTWQDELDELTGKTVSIEAYNVSNVYGQAAFSAKMGVDQVDLVIAPENETRLLSESGAITKPVKLDLGDLYFSVTVNAVQGDVLDTMISYFEEKFGVDLK